MNFSIDLAPLLLLGCRRCKKPFIAGDVASVRQHAPKGRPNQIVRSGEELFSLSVYHDRCVPPVWWHRDQVAGSRPASDAPLDSVPPSWSTLSSGRRDDRDPR